MHKFCMISRPWTHHTHSSHSVELNEHVLYDSSVCGIHSYVCAYVYVCVQYIYTCTYVCTHVYICIYINTNTYLTVNIAYSWIVWTYSTVTIMKVVLAVWSIVLIVCLCILCDLTVLHGVLTSDETQACVEQQEFTLLQRHEANNSCRATLIGFCVPCTFTFNISLKSAVLIDICSTLSVLTVLYKVQGWQCTGGHECSNRDRQEKAFLVFNFYQCRNKALIMFELFSLCLQNLIYCDKLLYLMNELQVFYMITQTSKHTANSTQSSC